MQNKAVSIAVINPKVPHIVYASDDGFAEILGVSLVSLYENSKDAEEIVVYVLDSGISDENKEKLCSLPAAYGRAALQFIPARDVSRILNMEVETDRGSLSQYARLFVSRDLPADLDRVLYLDCDIIVNETITQLWALDMEGKTLAALADAFSRQYRRNIGLEPHDIMFNSGVMLIDLNRWKAENVEDRLLSFIRKHRGVIQQGDQGALNAVLSRDTVRLHPRFNSVTIFYDFTYEELLLYRKPVDFYTEQEVAEAVAHPAIIHFTTSFVSARPWYPGCGHRYGAVWQKFHAMSPWADAPLRQPKPRKGLSGAYVTLSEKLPRRMMLHISGWLQAYGRPLLYRIKG